MKRTSDVETNDTPLTFKNSDDIAYLLRSQNEILSELIKLEARMKRIESKEKLRELKGE